MSAKEPAASLFYFKGADTMARVTVFLLFVQGGALTVAIDVFLSMLGVFLIAEMGWWISGGLVVLLLVLMVGMRASVKIEIDQVTVVKSWFCVPYFRRQGPCLEDIWYGGDWDEPESAIGVVLLIAGEEVVIGSGKSLRWLHAELSPLAARTEGWSKHFLLEDL